MAEEFPTGVSVLHPDWPDARFNLSGMFIHHPLIIQLILMVEQTFKARLPLDSIHGAPNVPWNAGRFSRAPFSLNEFRSVLEFLYSRNIGYFATFTNHLVEPADLANPIGNTILQIISERPDLNGVIVTSELLVKYISEKYPSLRLIASITKVALEDGAGRPEYYAELGKRFCRYVVHPDDCCKPQVLSKLDPLKAEIIVNENCVRDCPSRNHHFDAYARMQRTATPDDRDRIRREVDQIVAACQSPIRLNRLGNERRSCNLTRAEMKVVYDMGFRHFKLQGRADDPGSNAYDITRFMLEPGFAAPLMLKAVTRWLEEAVRRVPDGAPANAPVFVHA